MEFVSGDSLKAPQSRRPDRRMMSGGMATCILALVIAMTNAALAPWLGLPEAYGRSLFLLMFGVGLAFIGFGMVLPQRQRRRAPAEDPSDAGQSSPAPSTNQLPPLDNSQVISLDEAFSSRDKVPSVTENTTRNLS